MKRVQPSPALRGYILGRDNATCRYCGRTGTLDGDPDEDDWNIDHYLPVWAGGETVASNLRLACRACNAAKGGTVPADVQHLATYPPMPEIIPISVRSPKCDELTAALSDLSLAVQRALLRIHQYRAQQPR